MKERPQRNRPTKSRFLSDGDWLKKISFIPGFYSFEMADLYLPSVNVCLRLGFGALGWDWCHWYLVLEVVPSTQEGLLENKEPIRGGEGRERGDGWTKMNKKVFHLILLFRCCLWSEKKGCLELKGGKTKEENRTIFGETRVHFSIIFLCYSYPHRRFLYFILSLSMFLNEWTLAVRKGRDCEYYSKISEKKL